MEKYGTMSDKKKAPGQEFLYKPKSVWDNVTEEQRKEIFSVGEDYKAFLSAAKTERLAVREIVRRAESQGFAALEPGKARRNSTVITARNRRPSFSWEPRTLPAESTSSSATSTAPGSTSSSAPSMRRWRSPTSGPTTTAASRNTSGWLGPWRCSAWLSPETGARSRSRWATRPDDPVFLVSDLLIHLAGKAQMEKKISEALPAEKLNIICGSIPVTDTEAKERVKLAILKYLNDTYGITEEDFISAEIEAVPAGAARDIGFDRSMVGSYGQDDRASGYCCSFGYPVA